MRYSPIEVRFTAGVICSLVIAGTVGAQDSSRVDPRTLKPPPPAVPPESVRLPIDSVTASPGRTYSAGSLHRHLFGDLRRELWDVPFRVKVLRVDSLGGGLSVQEVSGGLQTLGLRLEGKDGTVYQFRSIVKNPRRALPAFLRWTPLASVSDDQMASQFPLGAMVVAELIDAVGVLVARPRPVIMPDDERLGEYRPAFAGRMGWIEVRPEKGKDGAPGFAGASDVEGTEDLHARLLEDPRHFVNAHAVLRARLVDMLVGDWDRHSDQWRWARFADGDRFRWEPIPRDRDWAFTRVDGALIKALTPMYFPQHVGFGPHYPDIDRLVWSGQRVDRHLLTGLDRPAFNQVTQEVKAALTDAALSRAVAMLPPSYAAAGNTILAALKMRRDSLDRAAREFYRILAREPAVFGTDKSDSAVISTDGRTVRVRLLSADLGTRPRYDRTFFPAETKEIRLFLHGGDDVVFVSHSTSIMADDGDDAVQNDMAELPMIVRVSTGGDSDVVIDRTSGRNLFVYNSSGGDSTLVGAEAFVTNNRYLIQDTLRTSGFAWGDRDWGSRWLVLPAVDHEPELGFLLGLNLVRNGNGFGQAGCHSCLSLEGLYAFRTGEWIGNASFERIITPGGWWLTNQLSIHSGRQSRFYGFGNDIPAATSEDPFTGLRRTTVLASSVRYEPGEVWNVSAGVAFNRLGVIREGGPIFDDSPYGAGRFDQLRLFAGGELDTRDNRQLPNSGTVVRISGDYNPEWLDVMSPYSRVAAVARWYHAFPAPLDPALHLRVVGERVWGTAPFEDAPALGGSSTLPGFPRRQFRGEALAAASALVRAKAATFTLLTEIDLGVHGLAAVGRVWQPGETSDTWHTSRGYGLWLHLPSAGRTLSITSARGNKQRLYVDFGFIF